MPPRMPSRRAEDTKLYTAEELADARADAAKEARDDAMLEELRSGITMMGRQVQGVRTELEDFGKEFRRHTNSNGTSMHIKPEDQPIIGALVANAKAGGGMVIRVTPGRVVAWVSMTVSVAGGLVVLAINLHLWR